MLRKLQLKKGTQGFTLIELMIVIAIIGILAAIAIPNFIAYRNKAFCSQAESDGNNIAAALSDYFAIPSHTTIPADGWEDNFCTGGNSADIAAIDPNLNITILVTDGSARCPQNYQDASSDWTYNAAGGVFTKLMDL